eukprot:TRINITY_DN7968_c0_g1_i15.p1 TRINITY_DN7968_c0_g1~~TRINITY_DN7968_c0_g1_i15.p1  ORF type:complete len:159 (+),score=55.21 TRINITY_DN7968_c0_g1_i15:91-567(+)
MFDYKNKSEMNKVMDGLYISDCFAASDETELLKNKIAYVVNASGVPITTKGRKYLHIQVSDSEAENIKKYFKSCIDFVEEGRSAGKAVLINCAAGISRSSSLTLAYMMYKKKEGLNECLAELKKCRPVVWPNQGFYKQLQEFEKELGLKSKIEKPSIF